MREMSENLKHKIRSIAETFSPRWRHFEIKMWAAKASGRNWERAVPEVSFTIHHGSFLRKGQLFTNQFTVHQIFSWNSDSFQLWKPILKAKHFAIIPDLYFVPIWYPRCPHICILYTYIYVSYCVCTRRPVGSIDQAYLSCFYFRISWILMERPWIIFLVPAAFCRASEARTQSRP